MDGRLLTRGSLLKPPNLDHVLVHLGNPAQRQDVVEVVEGMEALARLPDYASTRIEVL